MSGQPFSFQYNYQAGEERLTDSMVLPDGWYRARITDMEAREAAQKGRESGDGYINVEVTVTQGQYAGSVLFDMLFLWAQEGSKSANMTRRRLNSICYAANSPNITDLGQLIGPEFYIKVNTQEGREVEDPNTGEKKTYKARSQIGNYKSIAEYEADVNGQGAAPVPQAQQQQQAAPFQQQAPAQTQQAPVQQQAQAAPAQQNSPFAGNQQQQAPVQQGQQAPAQAPAGNKPPWVK